MYTLLLFQKQLDLYVAAAGFHPARVLPCVIDVGTNNEALRKDRTYLGLDQPRLEGDEYLRVVDEFVAAVKARWPKVLIQFEDFRTEYAKLLLDRYRDDHLCFNDDIQGTACTALAGVYGGLAVQNKPPSAITGMKFVVCGAGSAGLGVVSWLAKAMIKHGLTPEEAYEVGLAYAHCEHAPRELAVCSHHLLTLTIYCTALYCPSGTVTLTLTATANFYILDAGGLITHARGIRADDRLARFARNEHAAVVPGVVISIHWYACVLF
eukprot:13425-Heterococcus_DN1.PRE.3